MSRPILALDADGVLVDVHIGYHMANGAVMPRWGSRNLPVATVG